LGKGEEGKWCRQKERGGWEVGFLSHPFPYRVESPIIKHVSITEHFFIFFSFLHQIECFFFFFLVFLGVIGPINWRATNDLWMSNVKKQCWKYKTRMSDSLLQFFWKINFRLLFSFSPLSSSFFICFEWLKLDGCVN
jgi:hypothetical protein